MTSEVGACAAFVDEAVDAAATGCYLLAFFIGGLTSLVYFYYVAFFVVFAKNPISIINKVY